MASTAFTGNHLSALRQRGQANSANITANGASTTPPSPPATPKLSMQQPSQYKPKGNIPNTPLVTSMISAALGALAGISAFAAASRVLKFLGADSWTWARPQLGIYFTAMGIFHLLEFWTTAGWNPEKLSVDAFLLNNGYEYHVAHGFGLIEYFVSSYFWPNKFNTVASSLPALAIFIGIIVAGQSFRSLAMVHAAKSFSHVVKTVKHDDHTLVTDGVYRFVRHPSYVGFFYWAVATQLLLSNVVSTVAFIGVLGHFFYTRIRHEERFLIRFFGDEYVQYSKRVGTGLPFC